MILDRCDRVRVDGDVQEFTAEWKVRVRDELDESSADALRYLIGLVETLKQ